MAKEKPSTNTEEILNKLKTDLEEKERQLISVKSLELNGKNTLKKGQVIKEYGKEVGYIVKNIQTNQEGRKIVKLELTDGKTEEYELEDQKVRDEGKNIETVWRKIGTTEGLRIGLPNNEHTDKTKEIVKEEKKELEEDVPQIIVMENRTSQPKKIKDNITEKMPKLKLIDGEIFTPKIGDEFYHQEGKEKKKYTITKARELKTKGGVFIEAKINKKDKSEKGIELTPEEFSQKFDVGEILLKVTEERKIKLDEFGKERKAKNDAEKVRKAIEKEKAKIATDSEKIKGAFFTKKNEETKDDTDEVKIITTTTAKEKPKLSDLLAKESIDVSFEEIKDDKTEVLLAKPDLVTLKDRLSNAKTNIQEKLKGKSITDSKEKESKEFLDKINKERDDFEKQRKERIKAEQDKKIEEKLENKKDQARREYIEAKNQKQPFWKFGFGSKKREQEIKEKEEAYMKAKKEYFEASGKDKMYFLLEEKQKFQTENIEKKGLSERIKNGIKGGMNLWENWDKNEKDTKFTQELKKAGKTFVKIAIIGGASVVTVYGLAGLGIGTATALAGGIGSYVCKKAVIGTAFASMINRVPEKHRWWVSIGVTAPFLISGGLTTVGIAGVAGIAGYMGSKLIKNKSEENIKAEVAAKIEALKEKQNQKVEKESFEDFEKRQNAIEKELELIEKTANKDRFYRNAKKGALALFIGTATIEMSGAMQDYRDHHQPREYVPRDHDPIPKTEHHTTPIQETHTINPDAIIHKGEGIENAFIRQIEHSEELQKAFHWDGKENLHHFAQHEAHALAIKEGYVDTNGNEIRVNVADKVAYEIKIENGHATVFEKSLDGKLTDTAHHEGDSFEKNTEKYEYKTTGNTHLEKPVPTTEQSEIHLEKPTPVLENTQTNHPQELQADAPRLQFEERAEPALNLQYEHPQGDAGVMDPSSGVRNVNAFYTANHNEGPTNYQNNYNNGYQNHNVVYRNINPEQYYQNHIEHQHQIVEQATKLHDHNIHQIFPRSNDYGEYADKPVRDYLKMEPEDTENPAEKELIKHIHNVHASTDLKPRPGNLFRNPETIEHYLDRAYEEAIKQGKIKEVVIE